MYASEVEEKVGHICQLMADQKDGDRVDSWLFLCYDARHMILEGGTLGGTPCPLVIRAKWSMTISGVS